MAESFRRLLLVVDILLIMLCLSIPVFMIMNRGGAEGLFEMALWGILVDAIVYGIFATMVWVFQPILVKHNIPYKVLCLRMTK